VSSIVTVDHERLLARRRATISLVLGINICGLVAVISDYADVPGFVLGVDTFLLALWWLSMTGEARSTRLVGKNHDE